MGQLRYIDKYGNEREYTPYSPFPQFSNFSPSPDSVTSNSRPEIKVTIKSGTKILLSSIIMELNGTAVVPTLSSSVDEKTVSVSYTPITLLGIGGYTVYVYTKNELALEEETSWQFSVSGIGGNYMECN